MAPAVGARDQVLSDDARDPWLRATLGMWTRASKEGLLRSRPPVKPGGGALVPDQRPPAASATLPGNSLAFPRLAKKAREMREAGERLLADFEADLARIDPRSGSQRHRACADTARVMLALTVTNLFLFESWCQEAGPALCGKAERTDMTPPEVPRYDGDLRVGGWGLVYHCLCHGVAPFRPRRMAGGAALAARLDALEKLLEAFFARYDHTPYGFAVRRSSLTTFLPTYAATTAPPPPRKGGSGSEPPTTSTDRPDRGGGEAGGEAPTSGG
jgi:hypothetical protein